MDPFDRAVLRLAVRVFRQAFYDLNYQEKHAPRARAIRRSSWDFLTKDLWDMECLWGQILFPFLVKERVVGLAQCCRDRKLRLRGAVRLWEDLAAGDE